MERPFGSSEGLEIRSLFQQQPLIYIQNFPRHTPKQSHTSIPRRLSPDAKVQLSPYPAQIRYSGALSLIRPELEFPSISTPQRKKNKNKNKNKTKTKHHHYLHIHDPSIPLSLRLHSRHSAGRSSALMTSRFLTIEFTSAGVRPKRLRHMRLHFLLCPLPPVVEQINVREINKKEKISMLLCLVVLNLHSRPSFLYALIKGRLWPPSTRRLERLNHLRHIPIPAQISRSLFICKQTTITTPTSIR
jgi:hypothetical protein